MSDGQSPLSSALSTDSQASHMRRISTAGIPVERRLDYWRESYVSSFVNCTIDDNSDEPFWSEMLAIRLGPVTIGSVAGSPKVCRTARLDTGDTNFVLDIVTHGASFCEQAGRSTVVQPGEAFVFHEGLESNEVTSVATGYRSIMVADSAVSGRLGETARFGGMWLPADVPEIRLLVSYLAALSFAGDLADADVRVMVGNHIVELVVAALSRVERTENPAVARSLRAARVAAIKRLVEAAYTQPAFDIRRAARRLDLSERYIQKLFEETGLTFSEYLAERRLKCAWDLLSDRANDGRRIQEIAWQSGFSDISTFNRQFVRRFGETPSSVRVR